MVVFGLLILGCAGISWLLGRLIRRARKRLTLVAHLVLRVGAGVFLGILAAAAAYFGGLWWLVVPVPGLLALASFVFAGVSARAALTDSSHVLCRVGLHRWTDMWSSAGSHRACARCGVGATATRRTTWLAAFLAATAFVVGTPTVPIAIGAYVITRPPPNYSLARSAACLRRHGFTVSRFHAYHDTITIRRHRWDVDATFLPSEAAAAREADAGDSFPPVPVRNVVFDREDTFDYQPILACLRTDKD